MTENATQGDPGDLEPGARVVPIHWVNVEDVPIAFANTFGSQIVTAGEFVLIFGQITPPLLIDPSAEEVAAVEAIQSRTIFRLGLSEPRLRELSDLILRQLARNRQLSGEEEQS